MTKNNSKSVSTCGGVSFENSVVSLVSNGSPSAFRTCDYDRRQVEKDYYLPKKEGK